MSEVPETFFLDEVRAAADWWVDALAKPAPQDNGDGFQSVFATDLMLSALMRIAPMTNDEREKLRDSLRFAFQDRCYTPTPYDPRPWREDQPDWASYNRCVGVDYGPEPTLEQALERALGIDRARQFSLMWPIKTTMWIDPGSVRVRHGYGADIVEIYKSAESVRAA